MSSDFRLEYPEDDSPEAMFRVVQQVVSLLKGNKFFGAPIKIDAHNTPVVKMQNLAPASPVQSVHDKLGNKRFEITSEGVITHYNAAGQKVQETDSTGAVKLYDSAGNALIDTTGGVVKGPGGTNVVTTDATQTLKNKNITVANGNVFGGITAQMLDGSTTNGARGVAGCLARTSAFSLGDSGTSAVSFTSLLYGASAWRNSGTPTRLIFPSGGRYCVWFVANNDDVQQSHGYFNAFLTLRQSGVSSDTPQLLRSGVVDTASDLELRKGGSGLYVDDFSAGDYVELKIHFHNAAGTFAMQTEPPTYLGAFRVVQE
jgi:hypothetical protein